MSLQLLGHVKLPGNLKPGGFDHAALHCASGRLYVAHTANDALDVIDCVHESLLAFDSEPDGRGGRVRLR